MIRRQMPALLTNFSGHFLVLFFKYLLAALCLGLVIVYLSAKNQVDDLVDDEQVYLDHTYDFIVREISHLQGTLLGLSNGAPVRRYTEAPDEEHRVMLVQAFQNLLRHFPDYNQARYLSPEGQEIVRVNQSADGPIEVPQELLQDKSGRYYFKDSIGLPEGQVYLSPLDLNVENGVIERPFHPMVRLATPLYDLNHSLKGLLVLNLSADRLLSMLEQVLARGQGDPMLLNEEGYWLYSRDPSRLWGFMLGTAHKFSNEYPQVWASMGASDSGMLRARGGLFVYRAIFPQQAVGASEVGGRGADERWLLVSHIRPSQLLIGRMGSMLTSWQFYLMSVIVVLACAIIAKLRIGQKLGLAALKRSEEHSRGLLEGAPDGILLLGSDLHCLEANHRACQLFGQTREALVGRDMGAVVRKLEAGTPEIDADMFGNDVTRVMEVTIESSDGRQIPVEVSSRYLADGSWQGFLRDVSDRKESERSQLRAEAVFLNTAEGIVITDRNGDIVDVNPAFLKISGYSRDELIGTNPRIQQSGRQDQDFYRNLWRSLKEEGSWTGEIWNRRKNGDIYAAWENIASVFDEQGRVENYVAVISDISTLKDAEFKLLQLANEDALTGLLNRRAYGLALDRAIDRARRHDYSLALLYLDLDRFKLINDTLGHDVGDQLLQQVASIIKECVRSEDVVGRLGGDEFTVLVENISLPEDAAVIARHISESLNKPIVLDGQEFVVPASIGIALYPRDGQSAGELAKAADSAMYRAKSHGRNTYEFYTTDMTSQAVMRFETEAALRQALANQAFELYYQPQWDLEGIVVVGVEALIRWRHPERGLLAPGQFIPVAEESSLINEMGNWVIQEACRQSAKWREQGMGSLKISINLSGRQLIYGDVPTVFRQCLNRYGGEVLAEAFEFEVTETILQSGSRAVSALAELRGMGAEVAIDDFGKGYSSLGHLSQLPVDTLKIDQGFVRGLPANETNAAIVRAVISMARSMGLKVVAEGVEHEQQLQFLRALGCDLGQGYLLSKPLSAEDIQYALISSRTEVPFK